MIVKNRRRVDFYTHVVATTPEDSSSRRRIWRYGERSFPSMRTASFRGFFTSGRRRGRRSDLLKLPNEVVIQTLFAHRFFHRPLTSKIGVLPNSCKERIGFLEHVLVRVNLKIWPRGALLLSLKSPRGTVSRLTQHWPFDRFKNVSNNLTNWNILTLHHWGEDPTGTWTLKADGDYG